MSLHNATMKSAQSLLWALEGVKVKPPKLLQNLVDGYALLGETISTTPTDPADTILDAAMAGKLTPEIRDQLLVTAAAEAQINAYREEFQFRAERKFLRRFYTALLDGAADQVLDVIRPHFESVAEELATARDAIDLNATPQRLLEVTATADEQAAWGKLPELIRRISQLGSIAAAFGPTADFAVLKMPTDQDALLQLGWIDDRALMCTDNAIRTASLAFHAPNPNWQHSPWLRVTPKLGTIAEAQEKLREAAEDDFTARESHRSGRGALTEGGFVPDIQANPHALKETTNV